jgi:tripartite-type tricarboxylate transporter receptor subunit TctC
MWREDARSGPPHERRLRSRKEENVKRYLIMLLAALAVSVPAIAHCEEWPSRPVRVIVPFGAGGSGDTLARMLTDGLSSAFGHQFIVENRAGAGGSIGAQTIATAPADGYVIGVTNLSILSLVPVINKAPYDPLKSFSHIAYMAGAPVVLSANAKTGVDNLDRFKRYVEEHKAFTFASSGVGSDGHMMGEAIGAALKMRVEHVPYKSAPQALMDIVSGHVPFSTFTLSSSAQFLRDKMLTAVAVTSAERLPDFPDLPTFRELGYSELEGTTWFSLSGPAGMPPAIVEKLNKEINRIVSLPEVQAKLRRDGFQAKPMSAAEFTTLVTRENERWRQVVERAGLVGKGG